MNEQTFDSIDEILEQIDAEVDDAADTIVENLVNFSKSIKNITDDAYKASDLNALHKLVDDAVNNAKSVAHNIKQIKSKANAIELTASVKRNPLNTNDEEENERDD
jgi:hypothetical protein